MSETEAWTVRDPVPLLIVGLVIALGCGFLIGHLTAGQGPIVVQAQPSVPANYNPAQAIAEDAIKAAQQSQQTCWDHLQALLTERAKQGTVGH